MCLSDIQGVLVHIVSVDTTGSGEAHVGSGTEDVPTIGYVWWGHGVYRVTSLTGTSGGEGMVIRSGWGH